MPLSTAAAYVPKLNMSSSTAAGIGDDLQHALATAKEVYTFCASNARLLWPLVLLSLVCTALAPALMTAVPLVGILAVPLGCFASVFGTAYACHVLAHPGTNILEACQALRTPTRPLKQLWLLITSLMLPLVLCLAAFDVLISPLLQSTVQDANRKAALAFSLFVLASAVTMAGIYVSLGLMLAPCHAYQETPNPLNTSWQAAKGQRLFLFVAGVLVGLPITMALVVVIGISSSFVPEGVLILEWTLLSCLYAPVAMSLPAVVNGEGQTSESYTALV